MNRLFPFVSSVTLVFGLSTTSQPCSTFVLNDGDVILFGRNLDWFWSDGLVVVNQRGIEKTALVLPPDKPARWVAKYGSVTFNQLGREMPFGGMNEAGLVVEQMMLFASKYAEPDNRAAVNMLQWIQYQLDNCRTVDEVLATDKHIRIAQHQGDERIHYLICDASGDRATIEILDGKMVCHRGDELPVSALTNDTYGRCVQFVDRFSGFGGSEPVPQGRGSLERFARAACRSKEFRSRSPEEDRNFGFQTLRNVAQGEFTVWSIVYDVPNRKIHYRTRGNDGIRWLCFDECDFSPEAPPVFLDINASGSGRVAEQFRPLTEELHKNYLLAFYGNQEVKDRMGDQTPMVQVILALLRTYRPK